MRCLYVDLDGTLLGPDASLLTGADGRFSALGVRALEACARADVEVVIYSGRRQSKRVRRGARLIGSTRLHLRAGLRLVVDGELEWLTDGVVPSDEGGTIYEQIDASGAPALLLDRFAGTLEYHTPWSRGREVSHLFRGNVDLDEVAAVLDGEGLGWLRLVDNGVIRAASEQMAGHARDPRLPPDPERSIQGARRRPPHADPGLRAARTASRPATRARTWRPPRWSARSGWWPTRWSAT